MDSDVFEARRRAIEELYGNAQVPREDGPQSGGAKKVAGMLGRVIGGLAGAIAGGPGGAVAGVGTGGKIGDTAGSVLDGEGF